MNARSHQLAFVVRACRSGSESSGTTACSAMLRTRVITIIQVSIGSNASHMLLGQLATDIGSAGVYPLDIRLVSSDDTLEKRIITHLVRLPEAAEERIARSTEVER